METRKPLTLLLCRKELERKPEEKTGGKEINPEIGRKPKANPGWQPRKENKNERKN
jgi:hypothetical protein